MINTCATRFQPILIEMSVTSGIIKNAKLNKTTEKIVVCITPIFLAIASFEALVINGTRLFLNAFIFILNSTYGYWFPNEILTAQSAPQPRPRPVKVDSSAPTSPKISMPPISPLHKGHIEFIVKTCATGGPITLLQQKSTLEQHGEDIKPHVHPFQFIEVIFGKNSLVKVHMPDLLNNMMTTNKFLDGFSRSITNPVHSKMTDLYIQSFAMRVRTTPDKVRSFGDLTDREHWRGLLKHLEQIHCSK